jgi:hypothetical protein
LPITYRWRRSGVSLATNILNSTVGYYTITNVQGSNVWDCIVTNLARASGSILQSARVGVYAVPDADGDGIPDGWESAYGLNATNSADAVVDSDGDTVNNRDEYISGTDPLDPQSYLKVDRITGGSAATLSFLAVSNRTYSVLYAPSLPAASWSILANVPARPTNHVETVEDPSPGEIRYYRLATPIQ